MRKRNRIAALAILFSLMTSTAALAGTWEGQEGAWRYQNDDGSYAAAQWVSDHGNWYYMEADGLMKTGWYQDAAGIWYYLEPGSGVMVANTTKNIEGTDYSFDISGMWIQNQRVDGWNGLTYTNHGMDFQFTIPEGYSISDDFSSFGDNAQYMRVVVQSADTNVAIGIALFDLPEIAQQNITARQMAEAMSSYFNTSPMVETVNFNGCTYEKTMLVSNILFNSDTYFRRVGNQIIMVETVYTTDRKAETDSVIATIKSAN